ncbi:SOS response-associated peptidase [Legionella gresilensis]|uniref:SOS response-associated peptidase n=1 Tax=Legionella gresilensis TaxID=91823 RepID=UPI0010411E73|nr:SOS response-associated peptidase [Legionella gresilensis]
MCGRFVLEINAERLKEQFGQVAIDSLPQGYNIAPTEQVLCLRQTEQGLLAEKMKWGITPWYQTEKNTILFNARQESVAEKPVFRQSFKHRRCLMLMSGFFEWHHMKQADSVKKQPFYITREDKKLLAIAAIWERGKTEEKTNNLPSCCLLTTEANDVIKKVHNRMPWILNKEQQEFWLQMEPLEADHLELIKQLNQPIELDYFPVHTIVNNARYKAKDTINPL